MSGQGGGDKVLIEDPQQKSCLGGDLWTLRQQDFFTDLALKGSDNKQVKAHLNVISVASPFVKNYAVDSETQYRTEGKVIMDISSYSSKIIGYFVSFAYRSQVLIPSESVRDLYNLADHLMDVTLQQAITNTVGSIPANIPNIAETLTKGEPEYDLDEKERAQWLNAMAKKTPGRRKGRLPKKNHVKKEASPETTSSPMAEAEPSTSKENGEAQPMTRIKRKSAVDATLKLKKAAGTVTETATGEADDDNDNDSGWMNADDDDNNESSMITYTAPRRRLLRRKAKTAAARRKPARPVTRPSCDPPELEWVDGKPSTLCKRCDRTLCLHRSTVISKEELEYHIKEEGGMVIDAPLASPPATIQTTSPAMVTSRAPTTVSAGTAAAAAVAAAAGGDNEMKSDDVAGGNSDVRESIDALLSMARGGGGVVASTAVATSGSGSGGGVTGIEQVAAALRGNEETAGEASTTSGGNETDTNAENLTTDKELKLEDGEKKDEEKELEEGEEEEEEEGDPDQPDAPTASPLRTKYKLWVDPVSKKTRKLFPCEHCGNLYLALARLIRHMPTHTGVFPFLCPLCPSSFKTKDEMTKHDRRKHRSTASTGFPGAQYQCQQCAVAYHTRNALQRHLNNHSNDTRQPRANYVLKRKPSSNRLVRTYPCPHCSAEFSKASEFEGHMSSHTGIKLYRCRLCNKGFGTESYLKKHMLRHAVDKSYICALCGSAFKTSSGLYTHEHSVHIENKPFVCEVCHKEFKMKWSMKEHLRMAHSDYVLPKGETSDWQCSYCGGFLPSEIMFKIHEKLHITDKPFKCRLCPASFKYRAARLSHERREHEGVQQDPRLVMPRTPSAPSSSSSSSSPSKRPAPPQDHPSFHRPSTVRRIDESSSSSTHYMENMYYPQHAPQHPLPPAQSFMHQHHQQQQQQQQQQPQQQHHSLPSPHTHTHSRENTPGRGTVTSLPMTSPQHFPTTPSHTPTPSEVAAAAAYHGNSSRVSTPNFSHPGQSPTPTDLQPVYSSAHILPSAAVAASVLYDPSSYYMAAAAGAHLAPPPPPPPAHPTHPSLSLPPPNSHHLSSPSPSLVTTSSAPHQPPAIVAPSSSNNRSTPQSPQLAPMTCSICNVTYENHEALWNHMGLVHNIM